MFASKRERERKALFAKSPFVIGMVHLKPLPGSPRYQGPFSEVIESAKEDTVNLAKGGVDGIMVENFFDAPFAPRRVETETIAAMSIAQREVVAAAKAVNTKLRMGINVLRNDGLSALAIASVSSTDFIRVNVLSAARVSDQGIIEGIAYQLARYRAALGAKHIKIFADLDVKHSAALAKIPKEIEAEDLVHRGAADGIIVTGPSTGRAIDASILDGGLENLGVPIIVGSGVNAETVGKLSSRVDGFIVGTSLKLDGRIEGAVDVNRVRAFIQALEETRALK